MRVEELRQFYAKLIKKFQSSEELAVLYDKYQEKYPNLSIDHVQLLVRNINANIIDGFEPLTCDTIEARENAAMWLKKSCQEIPMSERKHITWSARQLFWLEKKTDKIQNSFTKLAKLPAVDNPEDYIPLIHDIKEERVELITNYVLNSISHTDKHSVAESDNARPSKRVKTSPKDTSSLTWTERVK